MLPTKATFDEYVKKGLVRSQKYKDLTIYQYTEFTQFESLWNNCTLNARGIVFDNDVSLSSSIMMNLTASRLRN